MQQVQKMQPVQSRQAGFTLIELVVVIVILGILAASAIPRFADMSIQAKQASRDGVEGAVRSANALAHAQALVEDKTGPTNSVTLEGQTVNLAFGYAAGTTTGIGEAVDTDVTVSCTTGVCTWQIEGQTDCTVTYTEAANATTPPVIGGNLACL